MVLFIDEAPDKESFISIKKSQSCLALFEAGAYKDMGKIGFFTGMKQTLGKSKKRDLVTATKSRFLLFIWIKVGTTILKSNLSDCG